MTILILGGYGNFGKRISAALVAKGIPVIIAGRNAEKAEVLVTELRALYPASTIAAAVVDINSSLAEQLDALKPLTLIHTAGPFQGADYSVAETCVARGVHYIDLADGRETPLPA